MLCLRFTRLPMARLSLARLTHALFPAVFGRGIRARPRFQLDALAARGRARRMGPRGPTAVHGLLQASGSCESMRVCCYFGQGWFCDLLLRLLSVLIVLSLRGRKDFLERFSIQMIYGLIARRMCPLCNFRAFYPIDSKNMCPSHECQRCTFRDRHCS